MPPTWLIGITVWTAIAVVLGVLIGKTIRSADQRETEGVPLLEQPITISLRRGNPARWGQ